MITVRNYSKSERSDNKMKSFYVISDVHGFYDEMIKALDEAGFDPNNENHWLISLGDEIDRGGKPGEVIDYLMSLPRAIFVKGNHQELMEDMLERGYPYGYDWSNGTMGTVCDLAPNAKSSSEAFKIAHDKLQPFFEKTVNYIELQNHILVHSFVPLKNLDGLPKHYTRGKIFEKDPNWRNADAESWSEATWGNPYELAKKGLLPDSILVFGHFHTSYPRHHWAWSDEAPPEFGEGADFSIYYGDGFIGIDGCTAASGVVNVLILQDEFL